SLINTIRGMALAPGSSEPWLGGGTGGVSGPAVRAVALAQVHSVCSAVGVPIIGIGGVQRGSDALDLLHAGAELVAVGTESFRDPAAGLRVASELASVLGSMAPSRASEADSRQRDARSVPQTPASSAFS